MSNDNQSLEPSPRPRAGKRRFLDGPRELADRANARKRETTVHWRRTFARVPSGATTPSPGSINWIRRLPKRTG